MILTVDKISAERCYRQGEVCNRCGSKSHIGQLHNSSPAFQEMAIKEGYLRLGEIFA